MRFLLVDRLIESPEEGHLSGIKNVAMSEDYLEHHFRNRPIMPGVLLLEALSQLAGWQVAAASDFESWFLIDQVHRCGLYGFVLPGDQVEISVERLEAPGPGRAAFRGIGRVKGQKRVAAEFEGAIVALEDLEDPDEQRVRYARLVRAR
ncbi:MAG: 3-hydroxyacyl-[acyl-carrier-protein] dehydratase FabZ [Acidobacteria bacterium]|nr:MAG: 3-hydroxyacyl-[acyl-carrier-protein] dehydratase FabZ [Acidobacteriota bacterium]